MLEKTPIELHRATHKSHESPTSFEASSPALPGLDRLHDIHVSPDVVALLEGDVAARRNLVRHTTSLHTCALEGTGCLEGLLALGGVGSCLAVGGGVGGRRLASIATLEFIIISR